MKNKFLIGVVASLMLTTSASAFTDTESSIYEKAILYLEDQGIVQGYAGDVFLPKDSVSRAEFLKMAIESNLLAGYYKKVDETALENPNLKDCFPDVADEWFAKYICYAKNQGWVNGKDSGFFEPNSNVNLAEAVKIIHEMFSSSYINEAIEENLPTATFWFEPYLEKSLRVPAELSESAHLLNREETSEILYRQLDDPQRNIYAEKYNIFDFENGVKTVTTKMGYYYTFADGNVYYGPTIEDGILMEGATEDNFENLGLDFYTNGDVVYYWSQILDMTDYSSFRRDGTYIFGNDGKVYGLIQYGGGLVEVEGADYDTFEGSLGEHQFLARDKDFIYSDNVQIANSDPDTFEMISEDYIYYRGLGPAFKFAKDANQVYTVSYWEGTRMGLLEGADVETFEPVAATIWKDKDGVFDIIGDELVEADLATFEYVGRVAADHTYLPTSGEPKTQKMMLDFFKDKDRVYFRDIADRYAINVLEEADPATFEIIDENFAKDSEDLFVFDFAENQDGPVSNIEVWTNTTLEEYQDVQGSVM